MAEGEAVPEAVKFNKLKQLIMKTLFVTEISYSLRQDQAVEVPAHWNIETILLSYKDMGCFLWANPNNSDIVFALKQDHIAQVSDEEFYTSSFEELEKRHKELENASRSAHRFIISNIWGILNKQSFEVIPTTINDFVSAKAFIFENLENVKPLCKPEEI